jgi:hypothetical protein
MPATLEYSRASGGPGEEKIRRAVAERRPRIHTIVVPLETLLGNRRMPSTAPGEESGNRSLAGILQRQLRLPEVDPRTVSMLR